MENNEEKKPYYVDILTAWLSQWQPAEEPYPEEVRVKTSEDIVAELADMVDLSIVDVAKLMQALGFKPVYLRDGRHGWAMIRRYMHK